MLTSAGIPCCGISYMRSQFAQYQIGLSRIQPDLDPLDLRVPLIVCPDRITKHGAAMVSVDHAQPVNGGVRSAQLGVDRRDRLRPRHVVNVDFQKPAERNANRLLALRSWGCILV